MFQIWGTTFLNNWSKHQLPAIAIARQIFQNKVFFFTSWGSFPYKKEKEFFYEKFAGRQQY
jgi:hypothetical protein